MVLGLINFIAPNCFLDLETACWHHNSTRIAFIPHKQQCLKKKTTLPNRTRQWFPLCLNQIVSCAMPMPPECSSPLHTETPMLSKRAGRYLCTAAVSGGAAGVGWMRSLVLPSLLNDRSHGWSDQNVLQLADPPKYARYDHQRGRS